MIVEGQVVAGHDCIVAEMVLRALGVSAQKAKRIAGLSLPHAPEVDETEPIVSGGVGRRVGIRVRRGWPCSYIGFRRRLPAHALRLVGGKPD